MVAFLEGRLGERATIDWALHLQQNENLKRRAILHLLDGSSGRNLEEPWSEAWRLIEESWGTATDEDPLAGGVYGVQERLSRGDRSGAVVTQIVDLVRPRLRIEPLSERSELGQPRRRRGKPKSVRDLMNVGITSQEVVSPDEIGIGNVDDLEFLSTLAEALDWSIRQGLDYARRIGWSEASGLWRLGALNRVYFVRSEDRPAGEHEADEFARGIAPSVKVLHAVIERIAVLDPQRAMRFMTALALSPSSIHLRLWAALARNPSLAASNEVATFLQQLSDNQFWDLHDFPEIAELRARRFSELDGETQSAVLQRIIKLPPRKQWRRDLEPERVKSAQIYWAVRELRRIELAGGELPTKVISWMSGHIGSFADLRAMSRLDEGFLGTSEARVVEPNPDNRFDVLEGAERLAALEAALSSERDWENDPAGRASDWIRQGQNVLSVMTDFETIPDAGSKFERVWERFGWAHSPTTPEGRDLADEARRVLVLLGRLSPAAATAAIQGISNWLVSWRSSVVGEPIGLEVWFRYWPIAASATNNEQPTDEEPDLNVVVRSTEKEPRDLDTLNSPAGKLVGVFLAACPNLNDNPKPFEPGTPLKRMRDEILSASGRSGLIAKHRLIEALPYFLRADENWTSSQLIPLLKHQDATALTLWRAVARQQLSTAVVRLIGAEMVERAVDMRLGREARRSLVFKIVVECLHALKDGREPAILYASVQQMIRALDDEVRASVAETVQKFVRDLSAAADDSDASKTPENLFDAAAKPFLMQVWPQERSLSTPGVSRALADLPATTRGAFARAVDTIERYLVPFDCWSLVHYGLYSQQPNGGLSLIDNVEKADALLRLLDKTIGTAEGAVVPRGLSDALQQIRAVAPELVSNQNFRRLATLARS